MFRSRHILPLCIALLALAAPAFAAWPTDPSVNLAVSTALAEQRVATVASDGTAAFVAWTDTRGGFEQVAVARVLLTGSVDPSWPVGGKIVAPGPAAQGTVVLAADGSGGVYVSFLDARNGTQDVWLQHLTVTGAVAPGWPAAGLLAGATTGNTGATDDFGQAMCLDGAGGVYLAWTSLYNSGTGDYDVFATRILANATTGPGWFPGGDRLNSSSTAQTSPSVVLGAGGNLLIAYDDYTDAVTLNDIRAEAWTPAHVQLFSTLMCSYTDQQREPRLCSDGHGGAFACWGDRAVEYVSQFSSTGVNTSIWGANGVGIGTATGTMIYKATILPDPAGGVYVYWPVSQGGGGGGTAAFTLSRTLPNGQPAAGWPAGGLALGTSARPGAISDGAGGLFACMRGSGNSPALVRYLPNGSLAPGWASGGNAASVWPMFASGPFACADAVGGAVVVWSDARNGTTTGMDAFAQQVDRFGQVGPVGPAIARVRDVPQDQGGNVRVSWNPSTLDTEPVRGVNQYVVYRQVPGGAALQQLASGRARLADDVRAARAGARVLRATTTAAGTLYWEQLASVPAQQLGGYSLVASTLADSVGASNAYTLFMVEAMAPSGAYWASAPDSGYSVDNLPPAIPVAFAGTLTPSATSLTWNTNVEPDLAGYRLYRGASANFVPGPGTLVASLTEPHASLGAAGAAYYKLSAVDVHGNESGFATLLPAGTLGVDDAPVELAFAPVSPNPARGSAVLRFALPRAGEARLAILDAQGRVVRTLAAGEHAAGRYALAWDGADGGGRAVAAGLYFARLEAGGRVFTQRVAMVR